MSITISRVREHDLFLKSQLQLADEERRRIGQDLHDCMGQELAGLAFMSDALMQSLQGHSDTEVKLAETLKEGIKRLLGRVRTEAWGLIPMEIQAGELEVGLSGLALQISERFGIQCHFIGDGEPVCVETNLIATNLYRIAQEAATNAVKHGRARYISIRICQNQNRITLQVQGDGFDFPDQLPAKTGLGLGIMRSRATLINASLEIQTVNEGGVRVTCSLDRKDR